MQIEEIVAQLKTRTGRLPRTALREAMAMPEAITPHLLNILVETTRNAVKLLDEPDPMAHIYALFLLAYFREPRAYPLIVEFFSLPGETAVELTGGDVVTAHLDRILASLCHSDLTGIDRLIKGRQVNEWVRGAAAGAVLQMVWADIMTREAAVEYFRSLFRGRLEREFSNAWNALASCAVDLYPDELCPDVRQAFEEGLVDPAYIEFRDVEDALSQPKDSYLRDKKARCDGLIGDVVKELEGWACFHDHSGPVPEPACESFVPSPARRPAKAGRNEPCPCGSGRKFKKCCGRAEMRQDSGASFFDMNSSSKMETTPPASSGERANG